MRCLSCMSRASTLLALLLALLLGCTLCVGAASGSEADSSDGTLVSCGVRDYVPQYGLCLTNASRLRSWVKEAGVRCNEDDGTRPAASYVPCATCPPGMQHTDAGSNSIRDCVGCRVGEAREAKGSSSVCTACPSGTSAVPALSIRETFDGLSGNVSNLPGWRMSQLRCPVSGEGLCWYENSTAFIVGGYADPVDFTYRSTGLRPSRADLTSYPQVSTLAYDFSALSDGWVEVTFVVHSIRGGDAPVPLEEMDLKTAFVVLDGRATDARVSARAVAENALAYVVVLPFTHADAVTSGQPAATTNSSHRLEWMVKDPTNGNAATTVTLVSVVVSGDVSGGVTACEACPAGYACPPQSTRPVACAPGTYQPATYAQRCLPCDHNTIAPGYGFRECLACEYGSTANANHTACLHDCVWAYEDAVYNFTALAGRVLNATVGESTTNTAGGMTVEEADADALDRVYFSLCDTLPIRDEADDEAFPAATDSLCVADVWGHNSSTSAYVCERTTARRGRHFGNVARLERVEGQVRMVTSMGSLLDPIDVRANASARFEATWQAEVRFECSGNSTEDIRDAGTLRAREGAAGTMALTWRSAYACPLCTEKSFTRTESKCGTSATYTVDYVKTSLVNCINGYVPPEAEVLNCTPCEKEFFTLQWLGCNASAKTETGVYVKLPEHESCRISTAWEPVNETRACQPSDVAAHGTAKIVSLVVGVAGIFLAVGLVVMAVFPHRARAPPPSMFGDEGMELDAFTFRDDGIDGLEAHYNVVGAVDSNAAPTAESQPSRLSAVTSRLMHSLSSAFRRSGSIPAAAGQAGSYAGIGSERGGYSTLPDGEETYFYNERPPRASRVSNSRRVQTLFTLNEDDNDELLPPS